MGTRILVTGSAGFIGGHLARFFASEGHSVVAVDLEPISAQTRVFENIQEVRGDIRDEALMATAMHGVDVVFHQAAVASVPASFVDPAYCMADNVEGSAVIMEQARLTGVVRVVMASTSAVYGDDPTPVKHEELLPAPRSPYAVSKLAMEMLADVYSRQYGMETVALRYFNVYGPGQPAEGGYAAVIPAIRKSIRTDLPFHVYGDGEQTRSFVHVSDVVRANMLAATSSIAPGEGAAIANITSDEVVSLNKLVEVFENLRHQKIVRQTRPEREGDIKHSRGSGDRAARLFDFTANVRLADGIRELLESDE